MEQTTFTKRNNARRAAERMIDSGTATSIDYRLHKREDGRIEIVWHTAETEAESAAEAAQIMAEAEDENEHSEENGYGPDPWPPGARVRVAIGKRRTRLGTVDYQVDHHHWRVFIDGAPAASNLYRGDQLSDPSADAPAETPAERKHSSGAPTRQRSKSADLDAAAARGVMPEKPVCTSEANKKQYQPRFDYLADRAAAGDWDAVRAYEVKGINSYAKMVKQYRDRLLVAHEAQQSTSEAA